MKWTVTTGLMLVILTGYVTSGCQEAFQCVDKVFAGLSIDTREENPMKMTAQALDGICQDIDELMECYGTFASCSMYKQSIPLPTSVQVSQGLKLFCGYKDKLASECPEIGQALTWLGGKMKSKFSSGTKNMSLANPTTKYIMEEAIDLVCQEKTSIASYLAEIFRCNMFRPFFNVTLQRHMFDTAFDIICDHKEVFVEAEACSLKSMEGFEVTALPEYVNCFTAYFNSLQNPNITSVDGMCSVVGELMTCSSYIKSAIMCRKGIFELMENQFGHKIPCSDILLSNQ